MLQHGDSMGCKLCFLLLPFLTLCDHCGRSYKGKSDLQDPFQIHAGRIIVIQQKLETAEKKGAEEKEKRTAKEAEAAKKPKEKKTVTAKKETKTE